MSESVVSGSSSSSDAYPAWFYRVRELRDRQDRLDPEWFDEDISEWDDEEEEKMDKDEEEHMLRAQNNGYKYDSQHGDFLNLRELRYWRKYDPRARQATVDAVEPKIKEVEDAYEAFINSNKNPPRLSVIDVSYKLYSSEYVQRCFSFDEFNTDKCYQPSIRFYHIADDIYPQRKRGPQGQKIGGEVDLNKDAVCALNDFIAPEKASQEERALIAYNLDAGYHNNITCQFFSRDYLKLTVPRELVFLHQETPPDAPEFFDFAGIRDGLERERQESQRPKNRKRSPSPRETWFEMNHPMGWWNQEFEW